MGLLIDPKTVLLLHCDGESTISGKTITFVGTAQLDTAQKKFGASSLLLDGNSDSLTIPDSNDWYFAAGDFTIDFWIRFNSVSTASLLGSYGDMNKRSFVIYYVSNTLHFAYSTNGSNNTDTSFAWTPSANTWYHIAAVRNGADFKMFVDGTQVGSTLNISTNSIYNTSELLYIGEEGGGTFFNGWMDEIRISKGTARWTANFDVPTSEYSTDEYTKLLLHLNGEDEATSTTDDSASVETSAMKDVSGRCHPVTFVGDAQLNTAQKKFGNSSLLFGAHGDMCTVSNSTDWDFGTGNFTIDFWLRKSANQSNFYGVIYTPGAAPSWCILWYNNGVYFTDSQSLNCNPNLAISVDTWTHIAVVRNGNVIKLYYDGVEKASTNWSGNVNTAGAGVNIGAPSTANVWEDEINIVKGKALWTANFTPKKSPYYRKKRIL